MEEFFRQGESFVGRVVAHVPIGGGYATGDCERTMNLPISYMCDRHTISLPESQSGMSTFVS